MKTRSKVLIGALIGILVIVAYFAYLLLTTRSHSPAATAEFASDQLNITVDYCRPYKKGRLIFGSEEEGALQPWGKYWRAGANEGTEITFEEDVVFGGKTLDAGSYVLYAIPGDGEWTIGLNSELGRWGAFEVDHNLDVLQVPAEERQLPSVVEQFLIDFSPTESGAALNLQWDKSLVSVMIEPQ
jgi:hypothetical protein